MSSADLDAVVWNVLDDHHVVCLFRNALEHQVLPGRLINREQLILDPVLLYKTGVLFLAYLTVELLEIVLDSPSDNFLLDLRLVPLLEAVEVDEATSAAAFAGLTQKLTHVSALGQHAVLAL